MTPQQAIRPANGALAAVAGFAVPIFWLAPAGDGQGRPPNGRVRNATLFVVDAGMGPFAVSANHVYEGYIEAKARHPGTRCRVLPKPGGRGRAPLAFDPEARLIARLHDPDIATFAITTREVARLGIGTVTNWPPLVPSKGESVAFAGFPRRARRRIGRRMRFEVYAGFAPAMSVNARHISCQSSAQEHAADADGFRLPPRNYDTGGMSGGPLFTVGEAKEATGWRLGGVISQGSPALGILRASLAERLLPGGGLRR